MDVKFYVIIQNEISRCSSITTFLEWTPLGLADCLLYFLLRFSFVGVFFYLNAAKLLVLLVPEPIQQTGTYRVKSQEKVEY